MTGYLLSLLIFAPVFAAVIIGFLPDSMKQSIRWIALVATAFQLVLAIVMLVGFDAKAIGSWDEAFQFNEFKEWITLSLGSYGKLQIDYRVRCGWNQHASCAFKCTAFGDWSDFFLVHHYQSEGLFYALPHFE